MTVTARQLHRATLERQLLLRREQLDVAEGVRRIVAIQAQEPASTYIALWNRLERFDAAELDAAFVRQQVIKGSLVRLTLHAVHADDHPRLYNAMLATLRSSRLLDRRFEPSGLTVAELDALVPEVLAFLAEPRTGTEVEAFLRPRLGARSRPTWWAMRTFAPVIHAPTGGPWSYGQRPAFQAAPTVPTAEDQDASVRHLVRRYLEGFGPATAQDIGQFSILRMPVIRAALAALGDGVVRVDGPGGELWDVAGRELPAEDLPAPPRLMAMWDSILLAYADRSRIIPPEYRRSVIRSNGDTLPTLLVDGQVAGVWRLADRAIEATAFRRLTDEEWEGLEREARALAMFLADRDPQVYRRYARWWTDLPAAEVRILGNGH